MSDRTFFSTRFEFKGAEMDKMRIRIYDMLFSLSSAADLITPEISGHQQQVARLAYRLAEQMDLPVQSQYNIFIEGMLHDIGALSENERYSIWEGKLVQVHRHAFRGAKLLEEYPLFAPIAKAIRYHHVPWGDGKGKWFRGVEVPLDSQFLYLADRTCALIDAHTDILVQVPAILGKICRMGTEHFMPEVLEALLALRKKDHVWLELVYKKPLNYMEDVPVFGTKYLDIDEVMCVSKIFAYLTDFRSSYTAGHSISVAQVSRELGRLVGLSQSECKMLYIAGNMHDLGKLAIRESILMKSSKLTPEEFDIVKSHAFYTYQLLSNIEGFDTINKWASFHHENMRGTGYPFRLERESIPLGSRIMAVADVFTAVTEDRPYRKGMDKACVKEVLRSMVEDSTLSSGAVFLLLKNFDFFTQLCYESHQKTYVEYKQFWEEGMDVEEGTFA